MTGCCVFCRYALVPVLVRLRLLWQQVLCARFWVLMARRQQVMQLQAQQLVWVLRMAGV